MAGIAFTLDVADRELPLARALLSSLKRHADYRGAALRYRKQRTSFIITVDGALTSLQAMLQPLELHSFSFAEGFHTPRLLKQRAALPRRLWQQYFSAVRRHSYEVHALTNYAGGIATSYLFDVGPNERLAAKLWIFSEALMSYHNGAMSASHLAEEGHTAVELLLREASGTGNRGSFAELVAIAQDRGMLPATLCIQLLTLKDERRQVKHRGAVIAHETMQTLFMPMLVAAHQLAAVVREGETFRAIDDASYKSFFEMYVAHEATSLAKGK